MLAALRGCCSQTNKTSPYFALSIAVGGRRGYSARVLAPSCCGAKLAEKLSSGPRVLAAGCVRLLKCREHYRLPCMRVLLVVIYLLVLAGISDPLRACGGSLLTPMPVPDAYSHGYIAYGTGEYDGQGSGHSFGGDVWHPSHGYLNNCASPALLTE